MAVANLGTPTSAAGNSATASTAHTVAAGSNVVSYIAVFVNNDTAINSMATFGGVAPVLVGTYATAIHVYRVVNPAAGATTAQANVTGSHIWSIHVISLSGVDQGDPDDATVTNTNTELAALSATVSSATDDLVVAFGLMVLADIAAADGATLSTEQESLDGSQISTAIVYEAGAASVSLGVSSSGNSFGDNLILAFNVNAAAAAGGTPPRNMLLLGVG